MTTLSHPAIAESLPTETLLGWLRDMYLIREFEIRTMQAYQNKKIGGFCHVYIGQEAVAVGCVAARSVEFVHALVTPSWTKPRSHPAQETTWASRWSTSMTQSTCSQPRSSVSELR